MIIMQPAGGDEPLVGYTIMRLRKGELNTPILNDHELLVYNGPKKPELPCMPMDTVLTEFQELQAMSQRRSDENNLAFLHDELLHEKCSEFNGYNTRLCREQDHTIASKTNIVYLPLTNISPAHPSTMLTYMVKAQRTCQKISQEYVIFTVSSSASS